MSTDKHVNLLDNLQILLQKQIRLAQEGDTSGIEVLAKQADILAQKIAETGILELPEFGNRRQQLQKLYDSLCLAITAQRAGISKKLSRIRKGKKTLETYRSNV